MSLVAAAARRKTLWGAAAGCPRQVVVTALARDARSVLLDRGRRQQPSQPASQSVSQSANREIHRPFDDIGHQYRLSSNCKPKSLADRFASQLSA